MRQQQSLRRIRPHSRAHRWRSFNSFTTLALCVLVWCAAARVSVAASGRGGQQSAPPSDISGRYEGVADSSHYGRVPLVLEIRYQQGAIVGSLHTPLGDFAITKGSFSQGTLAFTAESYDDDGVITVVWKNGRFVGSFDGFGDKGTVELQR